MKEAFELIRKKVRVLSEQEFCKRRKQEECDKYVDCETCLIDSVISIVSEVEAEYGNGCEKQTYEIRLNGCDDDTTFKMDLTESEYQFLLSVSELANKTSTYGCMPRLYVREYTPTTD